MSAARGSIDRILEAGKYAALAAVAALVALAGAPAGSGSSSAAALTGVDLSTYVRVGRFDLPEPTRTTAPPNSLLAQEASTVTWDRDTNTLFVAGDGGTSIVQVTKTGQLIDSMTLAPGSSPQGTDFYDTEGLAYAGGGKFVVTEERDRQANLFTYVPGGTLTHANAQTVKLGTTVGNIGIEGISYDPLTSAATPGFVVVKETQPEGIFQTNIDFAAGTATNGSPTTVNSTNLFDPALAGLLDFSDVYALSNLTTLTGPDTSHLLVLSQESGKVVNVDRSGTVSSSLTIVRDAGNPLSVPEQTFEGVTMDDDGFLYLVNEQGGGNVAHPQLWVYAPSTSPNHAPTGIHLANQVTTLPENTSTVTRLRVADVVVDDDGLGTNNLSVTGPDASAFEVDATGLYVKAGTVLDFETKSSYSVSVNVDDPTVGTTPDATTPYTLTLTDVVDENPGQASAAVTEVSPFSSSGTPYLADWWELTNTGGSTLDLTGWKMDDDSNSFGNAVALTGVPTLAPGQSAVFVEGTAATAAALRTAWFGTAVPVGFTIGTYSGGGVGLGTGGDSVNVFDALGNRVTGVHFGTATPGFTFDNKAGAGGTTLPLPTISTLSVPGANGAFLASDGIETGSPGTTRQVPIISEVSPWSSGNAPYMADWWELTNAGTTTLSVAGWKMDDDSNAIANAVALNGVTSIGPGRSAVFIEGSAATASAFTNAWFGGSVPPGFAIGTYSGGGVGLGTGGDQVNIFDALGNRVTGVRFGTSTTGFTFDNKAGIGSTLAVPLPTISTLSASGVNGAFLAADGVETGSPGRIATLDLVAPTIAAANTPNGPNGWNVDAPALVTVTASDALSGLAGAPACTDNGSPFALTPAGTGAWTASIGADGIHAVQCSVSDVAGNSATASATVKVDRTTPVTTAILTPGLHNGWYASPTLALAGDDGAGSGIDRLDIALDGGPSQLYTGPIGGFSTGNHFVQFHATDVAGHVEATKLVAFKVDAVRPSVNVTRPAEDESFPLGKVVTAVYKCVDRESGLDTCVGTVPNGANLDTSSLGDHVFTVTGTDLAGNQTVVTRHYSVRTRP